MQNRALAGVAFLAAATGCRSTPPCGSLPPVIAPASIALPPHDSAEIELSTAIGRFPAGTTVSVDDLPDAFTSERVVANGATPSIRDGTFYVGGYRSDGGPTTTAFVLGYLQ